MSPRTLSAKLLLMVFVWVIPFHETTAQVGLVSGIAPRSVTPAGGSFAPQFSADGRYIAFLSQARNLVTNLNHLGVMNVYVKEVASGLTTLASVSLDGRSGGDGPSGSLSVSSNGKYVVFESAASNLVSGDTNQYRAIFLRDLQAGTTTLVTSDPSGVAANGDSWNPLISEDGRYVVFESSASNLVPGDTNAISDIFRWDRLTHSMALVSVGANGTPGSPHGSVVRSENASMTPDGRLIAFSSTASNLVAEAPAGLSQIYLRDMEAPAASWISSNTMLRFSLNTDVRCFNPVLARNGSLVAFKGISATENVYKTLRKRLDSISPALIATDTDPVTWPSLLEDGSVVTEEAREIVIRDLNLGTREVTRDGFLDYWEFSHLPIASRDGQRIAFLSNRANLTSNAVSASSSRTSMQLFIYDRATGKKRLANPDPTRAGNSDLSGTVPSFSPDGTFLAFDDSNGGLVQEDYNSASDVFLYSWTTDSVELFSKACETAINRTSIGRSVAGGGALSSNGRFVAFSTTDTNVYPHGATNQFNVGVWDTLWQTNIITPLLMQVTPRAFGGFQTNFASTRSSPYGASLSLDGSSLSDTAVIPSAYSISNAYVWDLTTGLKTWVSPAVDDFTPAPNTSKPSLDASARFLCFESLGQPSGIQSDLNGTWDVYVYDRLMRTNILVSANPGGTSPGNGASVKPILSQDSHWVVFQSAATDLTTNTFSLSSESCIFARNLAERKTLLLNSDPNGLLLPGKALTHVISLNSQVAAFSGIFSMDGSSPVPVVMVFDLSAATNSIVCTNCQGPSLDGTGRWIAFESIPGSNSVGDVFVRDMRTGETVLASVSSDGAHGGNARSSHPVMATDGRSVVFASKASDLANNDDNSASDIFVRDLILGKTTLLSRNVPGTGSGNGASFLPVLSADGKTVAFQSLASDLVEGDYNGFRDVFATRIPYEDADGDGILDNWEIAYFGNLSRNGSEDFDGDGSSDYEEYLLGTDPTDPGSIMRVLSLTGAGSRPVTIAWSSGLGKTYRVQYKQALEDPVWRDLPGDVVATSNVSQKEDPHPNLLQRFYRVTVVE